MLKKSSSVLVLIENEDVKKVIFTACKNEGVTLYTRADKDYSEYDLIVCEEKSLDEIGDHDGIILLVMATTKIKKFIGKVNKFIRYGVTFEEFSILLYIQDKSFSVRAEIDDGEFENIIPKGIKEISFGHLYINFEQSVFVYKGKEIYLTKKEKEYVAKFLFTEEKLAKDRVILHRARKKFGKDFLSQRKGEIGETNEETRDFIGASTTEETRSSEENKPGSYSDEESQSEGYEDDEDDDEDEDIFSNEW